MVRKYVRSTDGNQKRYPVVCDQCAAHFVAAHPRARFCCTKCRNAALRDKKRAEARETFAREVAAGGNPVWPPELVDAAHRGTKPR